MRNRERLASWCAGVGPAVFETPSGHARDGQSWDLADLAIVSWNTHVGAGDVRALVQDLRNGILTKGRPVRDFVLLLQEVRRIGNGVPAAIAPTASSADWIGGEGIEGQDVIDLARSLDVSLFYAPSMRNGKPADRHPPSDRGNAILSTLPLTDPTAIELPGRRQRRVALVAAIEARTGGRPMRFAVSVAHLDPLGSPWALWLPGAPALRAMQARALAAALPPGPLALGADLNTWLGPVEPSARELWHRFPASPALDRSSTFAHGLLLDYIFFRPPASWSARYRRVSHRYGSDHHPLVAWFEASGVSAEN